MIDFPFLADSMLKLLAALPTTLTLFFCSLVIGLTLSVGIVSLRVSRWWFFSYPARDRKSTRLNSSHTEIYTLSLHDALPIYNADAVFLLIGDRPYPFRRHCQPAGQPLVVLQLPGARSEEHTSELQSHRDLHSFPTRRSSDLQR